MAQNEIEEMLDHLRRIKSGCNLDSAKIDKIKELEMVLRILRTFIKSHHVLFCDPLVKHTNNAKLTMTMLHHVLDGIPDQCKTNLNLKRQESHLFEFLERNTILSDNYELNNFDMSEYMDCLGKNINDVLMMLPEGDRFDPPEGNLEIHRFIKEVKIIQKKLRFLTYLYATEINCYVNHEKLECLETQIRFMANNVGQLCLDILGYVVSDEVAKYEYYDIMYKSPYLLFLTVLVKLEMKKIFLSDLKASKFTYSRTFKDKKLPKGFSHHLHSLLIVSTQTIDVAIEFLLIFLDADVLNHVINGKWFNEVMEKVGAIAGDVIYVIEKLLPSSINKYDTSRICLCSIQILEKAKDLKFSTFYGLSFLDSLLRKLNEMSKSDLDFLMKPFLEMSQRCTMNIKFLKIFRDVPSIWHMMLKLPLTLFLFSIIFFCSLPTILKEIKQINVQVTEMWSTEVALKPCYVVAPFKHLPTQHSNPMINEEIVGFRNDIGKIIQYLIKGTNELDVIPIVGMGGQGKTTIARKVYNSENVLSHFDD
ncbi:hypothetical protein H5410_056201 [Solanum commersonii]|uniref:NB-ARC domain-containing protein n=1 Tax=Solanum commersonii TaxID=4109 RepID=A0A9J5WJL5_SOLCO|nr:hypothetical protein H5410_056201 [Solanum commersonii]